MNFHKSTSQKELAGNLFRCTLRSPYPGKTKALTIGLSFLINFVSLYTNAQSEINEILHLAAILELSESKHALLPSRPDGY